MFETNFEKQIMNDGRIIVSDKTAALLNIVKNKYRNEYAEFFFSLAESISGSEAKADLTDLGQMAKSIATDIDKMLNGTASKDIVSNMFENMKRIGPMLAIYQKEMKNDEVFRKQVEQVQIKHNIELNEVARTNVLAQQKIQSISENKINVLDYVKKTAPELYETGAGLASGLTSSFLGPFSNIGSLAAKSITGIVKDIRNRRIAAKEMKLASGLAGKGATSKEVTSMYDKLRTSGTGLSKYFSDYGSEYSDKKRTVGSKATSVFDSIKSNLFGGKPGSDNSAGVVDLFSFFDKGAFKAKWTAGIYASLNKISGGLQNNKGLFGGVSGMFEGLLKRFAPLLTRLAMIAGGLTALLIGLNWMRATGRSAIKTAKEEDWFNTRGRELYNGEKALAFIGGALGSGKGIGEKGTTWGSALGNVGKSTAKGALVGGGIGLMLAPATAGASIPIGIGVGAGVGAISGALGSRRVAQGLKAGYEITPSGLMTKISSGQQHAADFFGVKQASRGQVFSAGLGGMVSGLTLGRVNQIDAAKGIYSTMTSLKSKVAALDLGRFKESVSIIPAVTNISGIIAKTMEKLVFTIEASFAKFLEQHKKTIPSGITMGKGSNDSVFKNKDVITDNLNMG